LFFDKNRNIAEFREYFMEELFPSSIGDTKKGERKNI